MRRVGLVRAGSEGELDEISKILGLTGKPEGVDGSRVEEMVQAGHIEDVARYCESDFLNTPRILDFWAKASPSNPAASGTHSIAYHSLDVAAVATELIAQDQDRGIADAVDFS